MARVRRGRVVLAATVLGLLVLALVARSDAAGAWVCARVRDEGPALVGQALRIERCEIDPLTASVVVRGVEVGPEARPLLRATEASVSLAGFFFGGVSLQRVTVVRPRVDLVLGPAEAGPAAEGCPLEALARVRVGRLEVQDGALSITTAAGQTVRLDGIDVKASLGRRATEIEAQVRRGSVELGSDRTATLGRMALEGTLDLDDRVAEIQKAELSAEGATVSGSGEVRELCGVAPQLDLRGQAFFPLEALGRLGVPIPRPAGQVWARVSVSGAVTSPSVRAEVRASQVTLGPFTPGDFSTRVSVADGVAKVEAFSTRVGEGEVTVTGEVRLEAGFPIKATVQTRDASLARILSRASVTGAWVDFPLSLTAELSGHAAPSFALSGPVELSTGAFLLASRPWDGPRAAGSDILAFSSARGRFTLGVTPQAVTFDDIALSVGAHGRTQVAGRVALLIEKELELDIAARLLSVDLADFGSVAGLPWAGTGTASVTVTGRPASVTVAGQLSLRDFKFAGYSLGVVQSPLRYSQDRLSFEGIVAQKGRSQFFGDVALDFLESGLHTSASLQLPDGRVEDLVDVLVELSPSIASLQGALVGKAAMVVAIDAPASALAGVLAIRLADVACLDRRLGAANVILRFEGGEALVLEPTSIEGPLGQLSVEGRWSFAGPLDYRVGWAQGSLAEIVDPSGARGLPLSATLSGRLTISGTTEVMRLDGEVTADQVRWKNRLLGPTALTLTALGREVTVTGQVIEGVQGRLALRMKDRWPYDSSFQVNLPDLSAFLPASAAGLQLGLSGGLTAVGAMLDLASSRATAQLDRLTVARAEVSAANVGPVRLSWNAGAIEVTSLAMKGPTTELTAEGSWGPARVNLRTQGAVDLRLLSSFLPDVERTSGRLAFTAAFGGPVSAPTVIGGADLIDARLSVKGQDLAVRSLSGHADFSESRVVIQDVNGFLNDGRLKARGDVRLDTLSLGALELQVDLQDVTVQVRPQVPATLSGTLLLATRGGDGPYQLSGSIDVAKLRYTEPLTLETLLENARQRPVPSDQQPTEWLRFDVDIAAGDDVRIENALARARFLGKLKLGGTNVNPVLVGAVEAAPGAQAFFRNNVFSVSRAVLQFNGLWPTFDFSAQSVVREFLVSVKAFGKFDAPRISLTAEPALSEADIVSLLTLGVTTRERIDGQAGAGLAAEALLSASGLDRQVQKFLTQNVGLKDQQIRLTTTFNEATGTAEPSVTWESKLAVDKLKIGVTQPVSSRGTRAQLEWRFNQGVSFRMQWDNQNQNTSIGNPGADLRFRFEWE